MRPACARQPASCARSRARRTATARSGAWSSRTPRSARRWPTTSPPPAGRSTAISRWCSRTARRPRARRPRRTSGAAREIEARIDRAALEELELGDDELVERLLDDQLGFLDAMRSACRGRCFGARGLSVCTLLSDGEVAQVEEVCTVPEARGRGLARAAVQAAAGVALAEGHGLVFLLAEADDWPKELYASLGFATVGVRHVFSDYGAVAGEGAAGAAR
jgi:GNAT superfamily N-acetyltransferase